MFYADIAEKIIYRGVDRLEVTKLAEISKYLGKATQVHKAGFGFFHEMKK